MRLMEFLPRAFLAIPYLYAIIVQLALGAICIGCFCILLSAQWGIFGAFLCAYRYLSRLYLNVYVAIFMCCVQVYGRPPVPPVINYVLFTNLRKPLLFCKYKNTPFSTFVPCNLGLLMATFQVGFKRVNGH